MRDGERARGNMFLTRFTTCRLLPPPPHPLLDRGLVLAHVITFPMMLSVLLLPRAAAQQDGVNEGFAQGKGRCEERRAQATRAWVGERESGARHLALPRGNLTFRLGLREPTDLGLEEGSLYVGVRVLEGGNVYGGRGGERRVIQRDRDGSTAPGSLELLMRSPPLPSSPPLSLSPFASYPVTPSTSDPPRHGFRRSSSPSSIPTT